MACIEICLSKQKPFLLIYWYRPPDSHNDIFDKVEHLLENVEVKNTDYILIGDLNRDLNKTPKAHHTNRLLRIAEEYELKQFVEKPNRVTATTSTLIDILYCSNEIERKIPYCEVVPLSDHFMVLATWGNVKSPPGSHKYIFSRNVKNMNEDEFLKDLPQISWDDVIAETDVDKAYELWSVKFNAVLNKHAPIKKRRVKQKDTPWMNSEIMHKMRERDKMKVEAKKSDSETQWNAYRKLRNKVTSMIRLAKRMYVLKSVRDNQNNPSAMWKSLRCILPNKPKASPITKLVDNRSEVTGYKKIASHLNDYFANVAKMRTQNLCKIQRQSLLFMKHLNLMY